MNVHAPALARAQQLDEQASAFAGDVIDRPVAASETPVAQVFL